MTRPTRIVIDANALLHNVKRVRHEAPNAKIIAMVKANAYGCGVQSVVPVLENVVDAFGVSCLEEAVALRALGSLRDCILFQGVFDASELRDAANLGLQCVIHHDVQLQWILATPQSTPLHVWIKVDTGMHRLGFSSCDIPQVLHALQMCPWIAKPIGLMTHFACADDLNNSCNLEQITAFNAIPNIDATIIRSMANSAAIMSMPASHVEFVRPGIMLYGVSPFNDKTGMELGLIPVMSFVSEISSLHYYPALTRIGYGGCWQRDTPSIIGVVPVGYGDGYPRVVNSNACVFVNGVKAAIVGRISMDMLTCDLTECHHVNIGDSVELWGTHIPVETVAKTAGTIAYELLCHISSRVRI